MACLTNYILVYGHCGEETPTSNLYINKALPGITLKRSANLAEGEIQTGVDLLNQAITNGIEMAWSALVREMLGVVRFNSISSTGQYGLFYKDFTDTTQYLAATSANRGLKFELGQCCKLTNLYVRRVSVLQNTTLANQTLTITDGGTVTTKTFSSTAKVVTEVEVNYKAQSPTVLITLNNAAISVNDSTLNYTGSCGFCSNDCCADHSCNQGVNVWGWDGTNTNSSTYGLSATVDTICDEYKFFCEMANTIPDVAWLVMYHAGIWFFEYLLTTGRINAYTLYNKETISARIEQWTQKADELEKKLVKQLPRYLASIDSCCIECNSSHWETSIP